MNIFMKKSSRKCAPKVSPRPLSNFGQKPKTATMYATNHFKNKWIINKYWKRIIKKRLKSQLYFFSQTNFLLMDNTMKNKRELELVTL